MAETQPVFVVKVARMLTQNDRHGLEKGRDTILDLLIVLKGRT